MEKQYNNISRAEHLGQILPPNNRITINHYASDYNGIFKISNNSKISLLNVIN